MGIEEIYRIYFRDVYRYILSIVKNKSIAEDITQDTFVKVIKNIDKYNGSQHTKAWLFTIARNTLYTYLNREKIYDKQEISLEIIGESEDMLEKVIEKEEALNIKQLIDELTEPYKQVFHLRYYGELSFEEIGSIFEKSAGWARIVYYRAKKQVLEGMEEENE